MEIESLRNLSLETALTQRCFESLGAVAQWFNRWPTDLAVPSSSPAQNKIFSTVNGIQLHTAFHYHLSIVLI